MLDNGGQSPQGQRRCHPPSEAPKSDRSARTERLATKNGPERARICRALPTSYRTRIAHRGELPHYRRTVGSPPPHGAATPRSRVCLPAIVVDPQHERRLPANPLGCGGSPTAVETDRQACSRSRSRATAKKSRFSAPPSGSRDPVARGAAMHAEARRVCMTLLLPPDPSTSVPPR